MNLLSVMILMLPLVASCAGLLTTSIGDILKDARAFHGKTVTIAGEVTESVNILVVKYYTVKDATGEIVVVTEGAVPEEGEWVRVTGEVNQAFAIAGESLVVLLESSGK